MQSNSSNMKYFVFFILFCLNFFYVKGDITEKHENNFLSRSWKKCLHNQFSVLCLKQRSLLVLQRLTKGDVNIVFPGDVLSLVKNNLNTSEMLLSEQDLDKKLLKGSSTQDTLDHLLYTAYMRFLKSRMLVIQLPWDNFKDNNGDATYLSKSFSGFCSTSSVPHDDVQTANKCRCGKNSPKCFCSSRVFTSKRRKTVALGFLTGAILAGLTMLPMALSGVGILAGKSLLVSILALLLSLLLGIKKNHGSSSSYDFISIPAGSSHPRHGRQFDNTLNLVLDSIK